MNESVLENCIPTILSELKNYHPEDIYNFDECELFYRMEPDRSLATKRLSGRKKIKKGLQLHCVQILQELINIHH